MDKKRIKHSIENHSCFLGIELGSTRIKFVLTDELCNPIASSSHNWINKLENGTWTYHLQDVWIGLQDTYLKLTQTVHEKYRTSIVSVSGIGISAMMHGYLAFDKNDHQLVPFRTWRNTNAEEAAKALSETFGVNIPNRWSIAHLYNAIIQNEPHVKEISWITTLAGYVHWKLTGEKVLGIGDASGMFPIDSETNSYHSDYMSQFNFLVADKNIPWNLYELLPTILIAGEDAGRMTTTGAKLLDPSGVLTSGASFCPPEGDAGTGMVATNSVAERTGNVSAGTSIFAMVVLERQLKHTYTEIDMVTTPDGKPVAMVHCNNCTSDLDGWITMFQELLETFGVSVPTNTLYHTLYTQALKGAPDCDGLLAYNYFGGEPITDCSEGRPLFTRLPDSHLTLPNFMRTMLYSAVATLKIGMDILTIQEQIQLDQLMGHGGFFKTPQVGQQIMATALGVPVGVLESAGEGGAWGIAILSAYRTQKQKGETLSEFLKNRIFTKESTRQIIPTEIDTLGFEVFMTRYKTGISIEQKAIEKFKRIEGNK